MSRHPFGKPLSARQMRRMAKLDANGVLRVQAGHLSSGAVGRSAHQSRPLIFPQAQRTNETDSAS